MIPHARGARARVPRFIPGRPVAFALVAAVLGACAEFISVDLLPPRPPADFSAQTDGGVVRLAWTESGDSDIDATLVARFGATGPGEAAPEAGRTYALGDTLGQGVVVFHGRGQEAEDIPPCSANVYAAWSRDVAGNWSARPEAIPVVGVQVTLPPAPPAVTATLDRGTVRLTWTGAPEGAQYRLVRKRGTPPLGPDDGDILSSTSGSSRADTPGEVSPDVTWHYAVYPCTPCGECAPAGAHVEVTPTLLQALSAGGFVVYWRHGTADVCSDQQSLGLASSTLVPGWWTSCDRGCPPGGAATARQLNERGLAEATEIGRVLKAEGIPFHRIFTSEYCRCRQTAERMDLGPMETIREVTFFVYQDAFPDRCAAAREVIGRVPPPGTNYGVVAHVFDECAAAGGPDLSLASGEAAIFRPEGNGRFRLIDKVAWNEWATLP